MSERKYINLGKRKRGGPRARVQLDGRWYFLEALWSAVCQCWTLTISDSTGVALRAGQQLRHGEFLYPAARDDRLPGRGSVRGRILVWDQSGAGRDPGRDDLGQGSDVRLIYYPAES